jgi:hypothetical protein
MVKNLRVLKRREISWPNSGDMRYHRRSCLIDWLTDYVEWDWRLRTAARLIVHPRVTAMWTMVWYRLRLTPNLSTTALWQPPVLSGGAVSRETSGASRIMDEGNENLVYPSPSDFNRSLTCRKILRYGKSGFTSHPKENVLRIFIGLKNPSPLPGLNPPPLGLVASTLTTTPLMRISSCLTLALISPALCCWNVLIRTR